MRLWYWVLFVLLNSCAHAPVRPGWLPPALERELAVDPGFTPDELVAIVEAATAIEVQTGGRIRFRLFSYSPHAIRVASRNENSIETVRADSFFLVPVYAWTVTCPSGGACESADDLGVNLISTRLHSHDLRVHVAMHELLHAVGVHHVSGDTRAVMAATTTGHPPLTLTHSDVRAICEAISCTPWL